MKMREKIINIIYEISENDEFMLNSNMDLLENEIIDSLGFMELISKIEEEFNIELQPSQISSNTWRHVSDIENMINTYLGRK